MLRGGVGAGAAAAAAQAPAAPVLLEDGGLDAELDAAAKGGLVETERDRLIRLARPWSCLLGPRLGCTSWFGLSTGMPVLSQGLNLLGRPGGDRAQPPCPSGAPMALID